MGHLFDVVTIHEQMLGANRFISRAKDHNDVVRGYHMIGTAMIDYEQYNTLPFDEPAAMRFDELRKLGVRIGTMDFPLCNERMTRRRS